MPRVAPGQRKRAYRPKTRTGCKTCKYVLPWHCWCHPQNEWSIGKSPITKLDWPSIGVRFSLPMYFAKIKSWFVPSTASKVRWRIPWVWAMYLDGSILRLLQRNAFGYFTGKFWHADEISFHCDYRDRERTSIIPLLPAENSAPIVWVFWRGFLGETSSSDPSRTFHSIRNHSSRISPWKVRTRQWLDCAQQHKRMDWWLCAEKLQSGYQIPR